MTVQRGSSGDVGTAKLAIAAGAKRVTNISNTHQHRALVSPDSLEVASPELVLYPRSKVCSQAASETPPLTLMLNPARPWYEYVCVCDSVTVLDVMLWLSRRHVPGETGSNGHVIVLYVCIFTTARSSSTTSVLFSSNLNTGNDLKYCFQKPLLPSTSTSSHLALLFAKQNSCDV